jgi:membrane protease YdiL (CAAX protease family)
MDMSEPNLEAARQSAGRRAVAPVWHTIVFIGVLLGVAFLQHLPRFTARAEQAPSRTPTYLLTIGYELFLLGYVWLLGLRPYKVPLRELIGGRGKRAADFWKDVGVAALFWIVVALVIGGLSFAMRFSGSKAASFLLPKTETEVALWIPLAVTAGFCEELIFRGYLQRQFLALTGNVAAAVALQGIVFGAAHLYQGIKGVIVITVYGIMFGILSVMRKSLRPGIMQHAGQDSISGIATYILSKYHVVYSLRL